VLGSLLFAATALLYAQVVGHPFIHFDDNRYVTENLQVQQGLSWANVWWALTTLHASNWHPLTWLSHMLDVELFGLRPGAHHAVNALLHATNAVLLFVTLGRMTRAPGRSLVVALLFAAHPLHVESVAWVAERKDLLSTSFGLLAMWVYARHAERPTARRYAATLVFFGLSLLAKPMWVTLPFLLLLLDVWPLQRLAATPLPDEGATPGRPRLPARQLVLEKAPLFALAIASCAMTIVAQHQGGAMTGLELGVAPRVGNALVAYVRYVAKTVFPAQLAVYYPHPAGGLSPWTALGAGVLLLLGTVLAVRLRRSWPWVLVGWLWFLGTLVPVIGLVQVGAQSMADRYTYLPTIGLFIAATWSAHAAARGPRAQLAFRAGAAAIVGLLAGVTWHQLGYWSSHEGLFRHALDVTEENAVAHGTLSEGLRLDGRLEEAAVHAREAVRLDPRGPRHWNNLGVLTRELHQLPDARQALAEAVRLDPRYAIAWSNLGQVDLELQHVDEAVSALTEACRLAPDNAQAWYRLGLAHGRLGQPQAAVQDLQEAVRLDPHYAAAWSSLGVTLVGLNRLAEAEQAMREAARAQPGNAVAWRNVGVFLAKRGRPSEASEAFREALRLDPRNPDVMLRLGLALVEQGRRAEALDLAARLEAFDPSLSTKLRLSIQP
jgi:Flp pilus assembly protein TadD